MVDDTDNAMAQILVWIMQPATLPTDPSNPSAGTSPQFDWNWARWQLAGRAIAGKAQLTASSKGSATFHILRPTRQESTDVKFKTADDPIYQGSYIAITSGALGDVIDLTPATQGLREDKILWFGYIIGYEGEVVAGSSDSYGVLTAKQVGALFDKMQVVGWGRRKDDAYPQAMTSPPTANIAGIDEQIIGNADGANGALTSPEGDVVYLFARKPSDCGNDPATQPEKYWTRWRLLRHLVKVCRPRGIPTLQLCTQDYPTTEVVDPVSTNGLPGFLNDPSKPEVFNIVEPTFAGQLDLLAPRSLALGWRIDVGRLFWRIVVYSLTDTSAYGLPANPAVNIDLSDDENTTGFSLRQSGEDMPDEVTLEGSRILWGGTISFYDDTMTEGWNTGASGSQFAVWKAAASAGSGYSALSTANKKIRNRAVRHGPAARDVYTRFVPKPNINGDLDILTPPGDGQGTGRVPLVPNVTFIPDTGIIRADAVPGGSLSRCPYLPAASLSHTLPWPEGVKGDGTDLRIAESKALPRYLVPRVFRYLSTDSVNKWRDLEADNGTSDFYPVQVDVDSHGAAIRVATTPVEALAKSHYSGAAVSDIDPTTDSKAIDYTYLVCTIAIESDQRISWTIRRPGVNTVRYPKKITDERYKCWGVHKHTILGIKDDGTPDRVTVTNDSNGLAQFTRNDFPALVKRAKQIAAFLFRSRTAVTITRSRPDVLPSWMKIGQMVGDVINVPAADGVSEVFVESNTVFEDIVLEFGRGARATASSSLPDAPTFGNASSSASSGGGVSVTGEGTVAQQVQRIAAAATDPGTAMLVPPKGGSADTRVFHLQIIDGQTAYSNGATTYYGALRLGSAIATVPSLYDPNASSSTPGAFTATTGISRCILFIDGVQQSGFVLGVHDVRAGNLIGNAVYNGEYVETFAETLAIPLVSDASQSVAAYRFRFM